MLIMITLILFKGFEERREDSETVLNCNPDENNEIEETELCCLRKYPMG